MFQDSASLERCSTTVAHIYYHVFLYVRVQSCIESVHEASAELLDEACNEFSFSLAEIVVPPIYRDHATMY